MFLRIGSRGLPLRGAHAGHSARTCALKCGSACRHEVPNRSDNSYFGEVVEQPLTRRQILKGAPRRCSPECHSTQDFSGDFGVQARGGVNVFDDGERHQVEVRFDDGASRPMDYTPPVFGLTHGEPDRNLDPYIVALREALPAPICRHRCSPRRICGERPCRTTSAPAATQ